MLREEEENGVVMGWGMVGRWWDRGQGEGGQDLRREKEGQGNGQGFGRRGKTR